MIVFSAPERRKHAKTSSCHSGCAEVVALGLSLAVPASASARLTTPNATSKSVSAAVVGKPVATKVIKLTRTGPLRSSNFSYSRAKASMSRSALGKAIWPKVIAPKNDKKLRCKYVSSARYYRCSQIQVATNKLAFKKEVFTRYLSGAWAKSSNYTWTKNTSVSASISSSVGVTAQGISANYNYTSSAQVAYSIGMSIPVSSKYYSKLGLLSDYYYRHVRVRQVTKTAGYYSPTYANYTRWKNTVLRTPKANQYVVGIYK